MGDVIQFPVHRRNRNASVTPLRNTDELDALQLINELLQRKIAPKVEEPPTTARIALSKVPNPLTSHVAASDTVHRRIQSMDMLVGGLVGTEVSEHNAQVLSERIMELMANCIELGRGIQAANPELDFHDGLPQ